VINNPFQTNVRANASYTIPWVDVLMGVVYQSRPGVTIDADWDVPFSAAVWESASAHRAAGTEFFDTTGTTGSATQEVNVLDLGDMYGERRTLVDLNLQKNIRFASKRFSFGVNIYNVFNSDAITGYEDDFIPDDPATPAVEVNPWRTPTSILSPRFMRFTVSVDF
jgi:hypothetical protein